MLFSWSCGGQECPDGVPGGYNWTANCLMSILSFYRPKKACKTPKIWCQDHTCPYATSDGAVEDMYDLIDSCKWAYNLSSDILWANNIISSHFQAISRHFQKPHLIPLFCIIVGGREGSFLTSTRSRELERLAVLTFTLQVTTSTQCHFTSNIKQIKHNTTPQGSRERYMGV